MKTLIFTVTLALFGMMTQSAWAVTVLSTTVKDVKAQCGGKTKCSGACGSTLCDYNCTGKSCTVAIFLRRGSGGMRATTVGATHLQR